MKRSYLDNASTTQVRNEVIKVIVKTLKNTFGNPSSIQHSYGRASRSIIEESRFYISKYINASSPNEIVFTSGGTEANNLVLNTSILSLGIKHIITSKLEHFSVLNTIIFNKNKVHIHFVNFNKNGIHDLNHIEYLLKKYLSKKKETLVSLMYANNEIGNLLEIENVIFLCKKYNAYFHSDTIQCIGNIPIDMEKLEFDFATASAHKFYGPKGIGFVFIRKYIFYKIKNFITGGNQEYGIRSGTENVSGIVGLSEALKLSNRDFSKNINKIKKLKIYSIISLKKHIPGIIFNGLSCDINKSITSILNFLYPIKQDHLLYFYLDLMGVAVSKGSSCNNDIKSISHVIKSITNKILLRNMMPIRISFGIFNDKKDIDLLIKSLKMIKNKNFKTNF